ncbi:MAG: glucose-1-phosphate adenylyltransferase [Clostridia bacterium]|nr:glucose-1-phosphate adenylyltransferase [Clostridia bacterium]
MKKTECVGMILAGGQGSRLGVLTSKVAKPAVPFGGKYRIIDFALSNCSHSGVETIGVLTQYQPLELNTYIGNGNAWDLDRNEGGVYVLPPYQKEDKNEWYKGTANAIYQNIDFIDQYDPEYVLILSGDHIYKMNYAKMIKFHRENNADATIAVIEVPWEEANRFGIMTANQERRITEFAEKPKNPKSNLASMGVYVFSWKSLKKYLVLDEKNPESNNDFGQNVIPEMLAANERLFAYGYAGYWKDVGTIQSLWEANMDLLLDPPAFNLYDSDWKIFSKNPVKPPHYVAEGAELSNCCITEGCDIYGTIRHSIISEGVHVGKDSLVEDSIIFPGVSIGKNTKIKKAIIGTDAIIGDGVVIGDKKADVEEYANKYCSDGISLIAGGIKIGKGIRIAPNSMVRRSIK